MQIPFPCPAAVKCVNKVEHDPPFQCGLEDCPAEIHSNGTHCANTALLVDGECAPWPRTRDGGFHHGKRLSKMHAMC